jgi:hypothetical protein
MGRSHGFWKQGSASSNQWPAPYQTLMPHPNTLFSSIFMVGPYAGKTLLDVVNLTGGPPANVARDVVAAYLNVAAGLIPPTILSLSTVKDIWNEYIQTGSFSPSAGAHWNADEITNYLETTFTV